MVSSADRAETISLGNRREKVTGWHLWDKVVSFLGYQPRAYLGWNRLKTRDSPASKSMPLQGMEMQKSSWPIFVLPLFFHPLTLSPSSSLSLYLVLSLPLRSFFFGGGWNRSSSSSREFLCLILYPSVRSRDFLSTENPWRFCLSFWVESRYRADRSPVN